MRKTMPYEQATDDESPRPITLKAAEKLGAFELARLWADPEAWPLGKRTPYDELAELAMMSALAKWLHNWQPMAIHGAMRAGARPEAVTAALGSSLQDAYEQWREWAERQRDLVFDGGKLGVSPEEYDSVAGRFAEAGISVSATEVA
jgi:hypothetical protein